MPEFRPIPEDQRAEFRRLVHYAFQPEKGPDDEADGESTEPAEDPDRVGEQYALYDGDEMQVVCAHQDFSVSLRGGVYDLAGLSAVASPPERRRQGLIAELLEASLREHRADGTYLSALWPFKHAFYRRFGWATANKAGRYELPPEQLSFAESAAAGAFRQVEADEFERLDAVHRAFGAPYALSLRRTEAWWRNRVFQGWTQDPYVYVWERDGEVRGYVAYVVEGDDEKELRARDLAYADREAYLNLLRFCYYHDSQVERVVLYGPVDDSLLDLVEDPRAVDYEVVTGPMFRLVDVPKAVEQLDYPTDVAGSFSMAVDDPLADWNDDTFAIEVGEGTATCRPTDATPDIALDVNTLSQVYAGYLPVDRAAELGTFAADDGDAAALLATMYPEQDVFLNEGF